jgi:hypothetical protein
MGPGCAKTPVFNLLVESSSQFGESENKNAGDGYPMKAIEKLVLRFLGSHTFSHGLGRERPAVRFRLERGSTPPPLGPVTTMSTLRLPHFERLKPPSQPRQFAATIAVRSWWLCGLCKGRTH